MSDWYEINQCEEYRHKLTGRIVRVNYFDGNEGFTGRVEWESLDHCEIEGRVSGEQEAQHFLEDFDLIRSRTSGVGVVASADARRGEADRPTDSSGSICPPTEVVLHS